MNTSEFARALATRTDLSVAQATDVTRHFLDLLKEGVHKGERIAFLGFGTFTVSHRAARMGVNPQNPGQKVKIPARKVVRFVPGTALRAAANGTFTSLAVVGKAEQKAVATVKADAKKVTAAAKRTTSKAAATATKDVKQATTAAKRTTGKVTATAKKDVKKATATAKKALKKATPKKRG